MARHIDLQYRVKQDDWKLVWHDAYDNKNVLETRDKKREAKQRARQVLRESLRKWYAPESRELHIYGRDGELQRVEEVSL